MTPAPSTFTETAIDTRLAKAVSHPLRMRILTVLNQRVASPKEVAAELDEPLGNVSYHTRILLGLDCIELVREERRRGAVEHYYRALERPVLMTDDMNQIPLSIRRGICDGVLNQVGRDLRGAAKHGGFDRPDIHLTRTPLALDEEAWATLGKRLEEVLDEALQLQAESADRVHKRRAVGRKGNGEEADVEADTFAANLVMLMFEQATAPKRRAKGT